MEDRIENNVPIIYIDPAKFTKSDFDKFLMSKYDMFYRRIVEFVLADFEGDRQELLVVLVDDDGDRFEMALPEGGYSKALGKALEYFEVIEEYETCDLIKQLIHNL